MNHAEREKEVIRNFAMTILTDANSTNDDREAARRTLVAKSPLLTEEDMNRLTDGEIDEFDRIVSKLLGDTNGSADRSSADPLR